MLGETGKQVMGPIRGSGDFLAYGSPSISAKGRGLQAPCEKDFDFQRKCGMLPTAKNRTNNSIPRRLDTKFENHHIFTTFACYKLSDDLDRFSHILVDFLMDVFSQRSGNSTPLSQLNLMVDSWTTKSNGNHDST
jgi:hypothetical protein